jgi:hypothetical protein
MKARIHASVPDRTGATFEEFEMLWTLGRIRELQGNRHRPLIGKPYNLIALLNRTPRDSESGTEFVHGGP